jgi:DNA-binding LytR/AlgR family response regulator
MESACANESVRQPSLRLKSCPNPNDCASVPERQRATPGSAVQRLPDLRDYSQKQVSRIAIKYKRKVFLVDLADVFAIVAQGNYVTLEQGSRSYRLRESISNMAEKLKPYGFIRIHRSRIINKLWVEEFRPCSNGDYIVGLRNGQECIVTKGHKKNLESLADLWFGNNLISTYKDTVRSRSIE